MLEFNQYKDLAYKIIGAAMTVHREMKHGLAEEIYNECLCLELGKMGIDNVSEQYLPVYYKGQLLKKFYKMDVVVGDIIVELKSVRDLSSVHRAQLFNYMRITQKPVGLLINFGQSSLQGERYGFVQETNECVVLNKSMDIVNEDYIDWAYEESNTEMYKSFEEGNF